MAMHDWLALAPALALLVWAAVEDLRSRRIPNWLTFSLALSGLAVGLTPLGRVGPADAGLGLLAGLGLTVVLFAMGALGGGDVKLLAGVGAWLGPGGVLYVFLGAAVVGMFIVLGQAVTQGRLRALLRNTTVLAMGLAHAEQTGIAHVAETGRSSRSVDKPLPYAVPVLIATGLLLALG